MTYRCLNCGFAQDFDPSNEKLVLKCHPWMEKVTSKKECPSCHQYIQEGGRKGGKLRMPHIKEAGILEDEESIKTKFDKQEKDFQDLVHGRATATQKNRYKTKRLMGFTSEELETIRKENEMLNQ